MRRLFVVSRLIDSAVTVRLFCFLRFGGGSFFALAFEQIGESEHIELSAVYVIDLYAEKQRVHHEIYKHHQYDDGTHAAVYRRIGEVFCIDAHTENEQVPTDHGQDDTGQQNAEFGISFVGYPAPEIQLQRERHKDYQQDLTEDECQRAERPFGKEIVHKAVHFPAEKDQYRQNSKDDDYNDQHYGSVAHSVDAFDEPQLFVRQTVDSRDAVGYDIQTSARRPQ